MSLRTSDRRHWCGSPPVGWKQLGFTAKMFENPGDCARRKYPWGTTPACALVRNDRAFSNSPVALAFVILAHQNCRLTVVSLNSFLITVKPKVCVIYGLILANHLETLTEFTHEELIVCKALENATDYDLKNFKEIMENYLKPTSNGRRIVFPKDFADIAAFTTTCDWCVYNRIFVSRTAEWGEMEEGVLDMSTYYYEANPASVLLDNINAARQTWNYG
mgnify:CR=1 FL=1